MPQSYTEVTFPIFFLRGWNIKSMLTLWEPYQVAPAQCPGNSLKQTEMHGLPQPSQLSPEELSIILDKTYSHISYMLSSNIWKIKEFPGSELVHKIFGHACFANIISIFRKLTFPRRLMALGDFAVWSFLSSLVWLTWDGP